MRLSGTGTKGSTLRLYFDKFANSQHNLELNHQIALKDLINEERVLEDIISINVVLPTPGGPEKIIFPTLSFKIAFLNKEFCPKIDS